VLAVGLAALGALGAGLAPAGPSPAGGWLVVEAVALVALALLVVRRVRSRGSVRPQSSSSEYR
jgi:hypothetical protein